MSRLIALQNRVVGWLLVRALAAELTRWAAVQDNRRPRRG